MAAVMTAVGTLFSAFFGATGYISQVVTLVTGNDFLLIGIAIMLSSLAISYLARLIHNT